MSFFFHICSHCFIPFQGKKFTLLSVFFFLRFLKVQISIYFGYLRRRKESCYYCYCYLREADRASTPLPVHSPDTQNDQDQASPKPGASVSIPYGWQEPCQLLEPSPVTSPKLESGSGLESKHNHKGHSYPNCKAKSDWLLKVLISQTHGPCTIFKSIF